MDVFAVQNGLFLAITLVMFAVKAFALVDAVSRTPQQYLAADKMTKQTWVIILGLTLAAQALIWNPLGILNLVGVVAALVYLADARPALRQVAGQR